MNPTDRERLIEDWEHLIVHNELLSVPYSEATKIISDLRRIDRMEKALNGALKLGDLCPNDFRSKKAELVASIYFKCKEALEVRDE